MLEPLVVALPCRSSSIFCSNPHGNLIPCKVGQVVFLYVCELGISPCMMSCEWQGWVDKKFHKTLSNIKVGMMCCMCQGSLISTPKKTHVVDCFP
jgi:hypothetical protein